MPDLKNLAPYSTLTRMRLVANRSGNMRVAWVNQELKANRRVAKITSFSGLLSSFNKSEESK